MTISNDIATLPLHILADQAVKAAREWGNACKTTKREAALRVVYDAERELGRGEHRLALGWAVISLARSVGKRHKTYKAYQGAYAQLFPV